MIKALLNLFIIIVRIGIKKIRKLIKSFKKPKIARDYMIGYVSHVDKLGYKYILDYHTLNCLGIKDLNQFKDNNHVT